MRVVCILPNASNVISGIVFVGYKPPKAPEDAAPTMVSEELDKEVAERFLSINGYAPWQGPEDAEEELDFLVEDLKRAAYTEAVKGETDKDRIIKELNNNLRTVHEAHDQARERIRELEAENAKLNEQIGKPSMEWRRDDLLKYAESVGLEMSRSATKEEILDAIDTYAVKNAPA